MAPGSRGVTDLPGSTGRPGPTRGRADLIYPGARTVAGPGSTCAVLLYRHAGVANPGCRDSADGPIFHGRV